METSKHLLVMPVISLSLDNQKHAALKMVLNGLKVLFFQADVHVQQHHAIPCPLQGDAQTRIHAPRPQIKAALLIGLQQRKM